MSVQNETTRSPRTSLHCFWSRQTVRNAAQPAARAQRNACSAPRRLTSVEALHSSTPHCTQAYREATRTYNIGHVAQVGCICQDGRYVTFVGSRSTADAALKRHIEEGVTHFGWWAPGSFRSGELLLRQGETAKRHNRPGLKPADAQYELPMRHTIRRWRTT